MSQPGGQELAGSAAQDGAGPSHQAGQTWALVAAQPGHRRGGSRGKPGGREPGENGLQDCAGVLAGHQQLAKLCPALT